jgi:hypothetical protein
MTASWSLMTLYGHALHPYIMLDASVPWFNPNIPIDREATATVAAAAATAVATTTVMAAALVAAALARRRDATINGRRRDKFMA